VITDAISDALDTQTENVRNFIGDWEGNSTGAYHKQLGP
jgi:hypothetical protein